MKRDAEFYRPEFSGSRRQAPSGSDDTFDISIRIELSERIHILKVSEIQNPGNYIGSMLFRIDFIGIPEKCRIKNGFNIRRFHLI